MKMVLNCTDPAAALAFVLRAALAQAPIMIEFSDIEGESAYFGGLNPPGRVSAPRQA